MGRWKLLHGDAAAGLALLKPQSVHAMATSVPYWLTRLYAGKAAIGREVSRAAWAANITRVMAKAWDVLRDDGTAFVVCGEAYPNRNTQDVRAAEVSLQAPYLAERLREDGWWIKALIVINYVSRSPMSVKNRPIPYHEYGILLAKQKSGYYWDYITSRERGTNHERLLRCVWDGLPEEAWVGSNGEKHSSILPQWVIDKYLSAAVSEGGVCDACGAPWLPRIKKAKGGTTGKSWLTHGDDLVKGNAKTASSKDYVPATITGWKPGCKCKNAGVCRPLVLDPFTGTSNVGVVAFKRNCDFAGIDSDKTWIDTSAERLKLELASLSGVPFNSERTSRRQTTMFQEVE